MSFPLCSTDNHTTRLLRVGILLLITGACASGTTRSNGLSLAPVRSDSFAVGDAASLYRKAGLIAVVGPVSYIGSVEFFATRDFESTLSLLTLSLPTRSLTFIREGERYRAEYVVTADLRRNGLVVHHFEANETVRVVGYKETTRADESVIFQEYFTLPPGRYDVELVVQDGLGSKRGTFAQEIVVPTVNPHGFSSSLLVHEATPRAGLDSLPHLVANARSTAVFGRDSVLAVYLEAYHLAPEEQVQASIRASNDVVLWSTGVNLLATGAVSSGVVRVSVSLLGIGAMNIVFTRSGSDDRSQTPLFISFGADLPLASFEDMLDYLAFYASPQRVNALREVSPSERSTAWAAFLRETDPVPETKQHEALQAYFARIQQANQDFREESNPGWRTDRGRVTVALGPPDNVLEPIGTAVNRRNATQIWEYHRLQLHLVFVDQTGFDRWRLTSNSELDFQNVVRREQVR